MSRRSLKTVYCHPEGRFATDGSRHERKILRFAQNDRQSGIFVRTGCWLVVSAAMALGCSPSPTMTSSEATPSASRDDRDALVQFSLLAALAADDYRGGPPLSAVLAGGDFGIGTFYDLDGEMIVLDGEIFQALADGTVRRADMAGTTPFAAVTDFEEDGRFEDVSPASLSELDQQLDRQLPRHNSPYAIRIEGEFAELVLRSVPAQKPPFRPLVEVVKDQVTWQHRNVRGTLIGLRCPEWMSAINVAGFHWHFISDDRQIGGHVLGCTFHDLAAQFDECTSVVIRVPQTREFDRFDADAVSQQDIEKIERQRPRGAISE